jgi:hypothetical protein
MILLLNHQLYANLVIFYISFVKTSEFWSLSSGQGLTCLYPAFWFSEWQVKFNISHFPDKYGTNFDELH